MLRLGLVFLLALIVSTTSRSALAADEVGVSVEKLELKIEIPRLNVSEYHSPYVAVWIQNEKADVFLNLALWYQIKGPEKDFGTKWLPDLRQWWRRSGRNLEFPIDGVTAPTRPPGAHGLKFDEKRLAGLAPGRYTLYVEAVREVGGRELLTIPFTWPAETATTYPAQGKKELGKITLTVKP